MLCGLVIIQTAQQQRKLNQANPNKPKTPKQYPIMMTTTAQPSPSSYVLSSSTSSSLQCMMQSPMPDHQRAIEQSIMKNPGADAADQVKDAKRFFDAMMDFQDIGAAREMKRQKAVPPSSSVASQPAPLTAPAQALPAPPTQAKKARKKVEAKGGLSHVALCSGILKHVGFPHDLMSLSHKVAGELVKTFFASDDGQTVQEKWKGAHDPLDKTGFQSYAAGHYDEDVPQLLADLSFWLESGKDAMADFGITDKLVLEGGVYVKAKGRGHKKVNPDNELASEHVSWSPEHKRCLEGLHSELKLALAEYARSRNSEDASVACAATLLKFRLPQYKNAEETADTSGATDTTDTTSQNNQAHVIQAPSQATVIQAPSQAHFSQAPPSHDHQQQQIKIVHSDESDAATSSSDDDDEETQETQENHAACFFPPLQDCPQNIQQISLAE